jgi:hypothetical protein
MLVCKTTLNVAVNSLILCFRFKVALILINLTCLLISDPNDVAGRYVTAPLIL